MPVAHWTWNEFRLTPMAICSAIGIVRDNCIVGSILFQDYNGFNVEMSYYGPATPSVGILRAVARFALERFNVDRLTIRTNRKNDRVMKTLSRYGFKFEGVQRRFYGQFGDAASFVVFREDLERISKIKERNTAS
jgi:RimJ/RimL family protein N-acetyltransferase